MRIIIINLILLSSLNSQNINVNNDYNYNKLRSSILSGEFTSSYSLNTRPINLNENIENLFGNQYKLIFKNKKESIKIKSLGIDYFIEFNSNHPYNRNNGTMIPNRGYQHIVSPGIFLEIGPLSIQFKPEHHFSENKEFDTFWEGHYPIIWAKRYRLWNKIDMPERFGNNNHNKTTFGQSSVRLNWKNISLGVSSENIWWGPSIRNSIMMSNHAQGFNHITFNSIEPFETKIGNFEWQFITGRLESSGFKPPGSDRTYAGTNIYIPKINQYLETDDWRYLQGIVLSYSPKWIDGMSLGLIRWTQMYSALVKGKYAWLEKGKRTYFPLFANIFRRDNSNIDYEIQTNEALGLFMKWLWKDTRAEFYFEFHHNDSKINFRDLLLDSDHSRAATIGLQKIFNIKKSNYLFSWEWTQMEQTAGRLLRNASSWYEHYMVFDGYTNKGEVLGSSIGPGSNSHYFSLQKIKDKSSVGFALEVIDHDNDFYYEAFASANDFRRYWKDLNLHLKYDVKLKSLKFSSRVIYIRSLNYQWELDDYTEPYYHNGRDVNNFHFNIKLTYFGDW
tara:strand:- start:552 stop:2231 length:1680 start_codon:yes stop_codon:yes gene_type:complete